MSLSRRTFLRSLGVGGAGVAALPLIGYRGHEALLAQGGDSRRADRLMAARPGMIRIDSNENPNGAGDRVFAAIRSRLSDSNRYPVKSEDDLIAAIAEVHNIRPENVILGCGSGELLRAAVSAFTSRDRALVSPEPTFEGPANWARYIGSPLVSPPVDSELRLDLQAMADRGKGAGLVFLCNPNNPTATAHGSAAIVDYIERVNRSSPDTIILIDEAYYEYVDHPDYRSAMLVALANPRVVVTRTFSKVFGMAGLRVGYAVGQPATLAKMAGWLLGSNISQLSLVAATVAVADRTHIALEQHRNRLTRRDTRAWFEQAGYRMARSDANFMMVDIRRDAKQFKTDCLKQNVAVGRQFASLPNWSRISFGTPVEMRKATRVFRQVLTGAT
jgi:histidinol-phosphate aminotransferase